ncbi:hypothetical protein KM043_010905 [Ampulex compressa]|nr:hypothetical protein KM043_010905 [Ampulex compressa]
MMSPFILLFACAFWTAAKAIYPEGECRVSINYKKGDLREPQPLLFTQSSGKREFLYPAESGSTLSIPKGRSIYLACPGEYNHIVNVKRTNEAEAVCVRDKIFNVDGVPRNFSSLVCKNMPYHEARRMNRPCLGKYSSVAIGFSVNGSFVPTIEVCRDDETYATYYTKFRMTKMIQSYQSSYPRPNNWWIGDYYPEIDIKGLYRIENQISAVGKILKSTQLASKHIKKSVQFLSRGHMAAKVDFVYGAVQRATFWYLNAAPQWQSFNGGNWNYLEEGVRYFAGSRHLDLDVYTGAYGQMTMTDVYGRKQPIHLYVNGPKRALAVPRFYWKVIVDPVSNKGLAFVGLNDPFVEYITRDLYICKDVSPLIRWLLWSPRNITAGLSYACEVDDLRRAVPTVPAIKVSGLLI